MARLTNKQKIIQQLLAAELQFRLASAVKLATDLQKQPLDIYTEWTYGNHRVKHNEVALRKDQADYAAFSLQQSATFLMASEIKNAIIAVIKNPIEYKDENISNAFQIARFIRNAFAHHPFNPIWSIEKEYQNKIFNVKDIIELDTRELNGNTFDWRHYGGPLAVLKLCWYVRFDILKDRGKKPWNRVVPRPKIECIKFGDLILERIKKIPKRVLKSAKKIDLKKGQSIDLGDGYKIIQK